MGIKHAFTSAKSDGGDATLVRPSDWNAEHVLTGLTSPFIGAKVYADGSQQIASGDYRILNFANESWDTDGFHSTVTNTSRLTIPAGLGGKYLIQAGIYITSATGQSRFYLYKNGSVASAGYGYFELAGEYSAILDLAAGDYVEISVSPSNTSYTSSGPDTYFSVTKLDSGRVGAGVGVIAKSTASITFGNGSYTAIPFAASDTFDTDGFHDPSTNNTRITIPAGLGGKYLATFGVYHANAGFGYIAKNGVRVSNYAYSYGTASNDVFNVSVPVDIGAGEYIEGFYGVASGTLYESSLSLMRLDSKPLDPAPTGFIGVSAYATGNQTVTAANETTVDLGGEYYDTDGFHDNVTNNSRVTIPAGLGGKYLVISHLALGANPGNSYLQIRKNGSSGIAIEQHNEGSSNLNMHASIVADLAAGDYLEMRGYRTSGTTFYSGSRLDVVKLDTGRIGSAIGCSIAGVSTSVGAAYTPLAFGSADTFDTDNFHDPSSNNTRITIPAGLGGKYLLTARVSFNSGASVTDRRVAYSKNGGAEVIIARSYYATTAAEVLNGQIVLDLGAGDYVEVEAYQDSTQTITSYDAQLMRLDASPSGIGEWTSYTPTWSSSGTQPTIGNGTLTGRYKKLDGKTYHVSMRLLWGSSTTAGTGTWAFSLPSGLATPSDIRASVSAGALNSGTRWYAGTGFVVPTGTNVEVILADSNGSYLAAAGAPMTWATSDELFFSGIIEVV